MVNDWLVGLGILFNSALYLTGTFVAGLATGNAWAWRLSLAAAGFTYLSYNAQQIPAVNRQVAGFCVAVSVVLGFDNTLLLL